MTTQRSELERKREWLTTLQEDGVVDKDSANAIRTLVDAYDSENIVVSKPSGESHKSPGTLAKWIFILKVFAQCRPLTTCTIEELNMTIQDVYDGNTPSSKNGGVAKNTLASYQGVLRVFYRYHDYKINPDDIEITSSRTVSVQPDDMLTREEIHELRNATDNPRDRLIVDLLIYTGQRQTALRTLRVKDIDLENNRYRYNDSADGLKGADKRQGNRPLLGATATVRDWITKYHPNPQPDNYLITTRRTWGESAGHEPVSGSTMWGVMNDIKEKMGIDKPINPHSLRHNFVTICKRDYSDQMNDEDIKYLIGHSKGSNIMNTTYSHLSGDTHAENTEEAWGLREPEPEEKSLTPDFCDTCKEPLDTDWSVCPYCGHEYGPDARSVREQIDDAMVDDAMNAETDEDKEQLNVLRELVEDNKEEIINMLVDASE